MIILLEYFNALAFIAVCLCVVVNLQILELYNASRRQQRAEWVLTGSDIITYYTWLYGGILALWRSRFTTYKKGFSAAVGFSEMYCQSTKIVLCLIEFFYLMFLSISDDATSLYDTGSCRRRLWCHWCRSYVIMEFIARESSLTWFIF